MPGRLNAGQSALLLAGAIWAWVLTHAPTFDFDESLYRSVASAMKLSGNPWLLEWDGKPLFHKPPVLYWLMVAASHLIDGAGTLVSSTAARIPSLLSTVGILWWLHRQGGKHATFAFLCGFFPLLTGVAVIFDPLQSLALLPALFLPAEWFEQDRGPNWKEGLIVAGSMAIASATKGLNGLLIPTGALGLHLLFHIRRWGIRRVLTEGFKLFGLAILPGLALTALIYLIYDQRLGPEFTREFLWVQHFDRSRNPMEAHGGGPVYHFAVLFFGGGFLTPLLGYQWFRKKPDLLRWGYPLTFALTCALLFTLSATKLPHYTWPAWAALALFTAKLASQPEIESSKLIPERRVGFLLSAPVFLIGTLALLLAIAPGLFLQSLPDSPQGRSWIGSVFPLDWTTKIALLVTALSCFSFQTLRRTLTRSPGKTALAATFAYAGVATALVPLADRLMVKPFFDVASTIRSQAPPVDSCIQYSGPLSATLSLALAPEYAQNRCQDRPARFRITPVWRETECVREGYRLIERNPTLLLCEST
jgi:4-amino-4-deoxy-L-arabinose transferase-like glycosyltransferase